MVIVRGMKECSSSLVVLHWWRSLWMCVDRVRLSGGRSPRSTGVNATVNARLEVAVKLQYAGHGSPRNLDSVVLKPSAFIAGQQSLGSHNDKFVSLFCQFSPVFNSIVLSKISLKCDRKYISQLDRSLI